MQMLNKDYLFSDSSLFVLGVFRLVIIVKQSSAIFFLDKLIIVILQIQSCTVESHDKF